MNECIAWLQRQRKALPAESILLDVGAFHGKFSEEALRAGLFSKSWLFEPNPKNLVVLRDKKFDRPYAIVKAAAGDSVAEVTFHFDRNLATGSTLLYCTTSGWQCEGGIERVRVQQITLDAFAENLPAGEVVGLIKVDTQGADLRVLKGAERLIEQHRPWLVVEMIYVALYEGQSDPLAILGWAAAHDYVLAGFFDDHYSSDGWLSYADAVFVPREVAVSFQPPFELRKNAAQDAEIAMLRKVCEERLQLINHLHDEAGKRLDIIQALERELRSIQKT